MTSNKMSPKEINKNTRKKVFYFIGVLVITVLVTRGISLVADPDPIFLGFEVHHFHYGLVLLILVNLAMLFGKDHPKVYLNLSAISIGLIIDELIYIANHIEGSIDYNSTTGSAFIFILIICAIILFIEYDFFGKIKGKLK